MRGRYLIALAVTGCADFAGIGDPTPITPDAPEPSCTIGGLDLCLYSRPTNDLVVDDDLVQNTSSECTIEYFVLPGPSLCVLYARNIEITATLNAIGQRPLVLVAAEALSVSGTVDVSSFAGQTPGAGANDASCVRNTASDTGAGAGGSFGGRGGDAGLDVMGPGGARKLAAPVVPLPDHLRGGCQGDLNFVGNGGGGGGGVWLAAGESIVIAASGRVLANGGGGSFNGFFGGGGGGGGGSGGLVRIAAPRIQLAGIVTANGGGGAEGGDANANGRIGSDGLPGALVAPGGTGGAPNGGDGGAGGAGAMPNGVTGANATGSMAAQGGSGGGGVGFIHLVGDTVDVASAILSPPPIL